MPPAYEGVYLMNEKQPITKNLGQKLQEGTIRLSESDRPENVILSALRMIWGLEERGDSGLMFRVIKWSTVSLARLRFWTPDQISTAIQEGRKIEKLANESEE